MSTASFHRRTIRLLADDTCKGDLGHVLPNLLARLNILNSSSAIGTVCDPFLRRFPTLESLLPLFIRLLALFTITSIMNVDTRVAIPTESGLSVIFANLRPMIWQCRGTEVRGCFWRRPVLALSASQLPHLVASLLSVMRVSRSARNTVGKSSAEDFGGADLNPRPSVVRLRLLGSESSGGIRVVVGFIPVSRTLGTR